MDLNLNFFDDIFMNHGRITSQLQERLSRPSASKDPLYSEQKKILEKALKNARGIGPALCYFRRNEIRREDPNVTQLHMAPLSTILEAHEQLSAVDHLDIQDYYSSKRVMEFVEADDFPYRDFYDAQFSKLAKGRAPDFVGISLVFEQQILHAFAAARWAKRFFPNVFVCLGGTVITKIMNGPLFKPTTRHNVFRFVDAAISYEGEHSILELIKYANTRKRQFPRHVSISFPDRNYVADRPSPYKDLYLPDYNGLNYDKYFNTHFRGNRLKRVPFLASRGCYWRKCRFCVSHYIYRDFIQCSDVGSLISNIAHYQKKFDFKLIRFNDEATSPKLITSLADAIIRQGVKVNWVTNMRVDPKVDDKTCKLLYKAGCRKLPLGVESGSQAIVDSMNKGIFLKDVDKILPILFRNGLAPHLYIICLYPHETLKDLKKTYDFLKRNQKHIQNISVSLFDGEMLSPIFEEMEPSKYILPAEENDFYTSFFIKKKPTRKMREMVNRIRAMKFVDVVGQSTDAAEIH